MGTDLRSRVPLLSVLRQNLPESALLAGPKDEAGRDTLYTNGQCLSPLQRSRGSPGPGRVPNRRGPHALWAQMAEPPDPLLSCLRTARARLLASVVFCPGGTL